MDNRPILQGALTAIIFATVLLAGTYFVPWSKTNWGSIHISPGKTITVTGEAETKEKNQIATFTAGVSSTNENKQTAVNEVNQKMEAIIKTIKDFGIKPEDIKTQNLSVYQRQETYYDEQGKQKTRPSEWDISNSIQITLRDVDKASELTNILTQSGATNIYGPNFSLESAKEVESELLGEAVQDAKKKAEILANSSNRKLGKVISVTEGSSSPVSIFRSLEAGGGGAPLEPGSATIGKTVIVVFELE